MRERERGGERERVDGISAKVLITLSNHIVDPIVDLVNLNIENIYGQMHLKVV